MSEPVLRVEALSKSFGASTVLRSASLEVAAGSVLGFVGPNGAGKSTCLRCILGICFPDSGRVTLDGIDAVADPLAARARTGYLPGETSLYGGMTGEALLRFGLAFHGRKNEDLLTHLLERFRLPIERKARTYSAGQKQLLGICLALVPDVPLYILDEPDKALDATMRHELRKVLRSLEERGKALLISSHHIAELEGLASDYVFLLDGNVIGDERIERERSRLLGEVRATFAKEPEALELPEGTEVRRDDDVWIFTAAARVSVEDIVSKLLPLHPKSLDYGHASLQDIYEALYLADR